MCLLCVLPSGTRDSLSSRRQCVRSGGLKVRFTFPIFSRAMRTCSLTFLSRYALNCNGPYHPCPAFLARALTGNAAEIFDHESHSLPALHRRLRRHLRGDIGTDDLANGPHLTVAGRNHEHVSAPTTAVNTAVFEAHAWEEEAPHSQLNGGSDPLVVTATHIVHRGHGSDRAGRGGVTLRITVYNATNARLHGFSIRFSFGQGGRAAGMGGGGRVEMSIDEVRRV